MFENERVEMSYLQSWITTVLFLLDDNKLIVTKLMLVKVFEHNLRLLINMTKSRLVIINVVDGTVSIPIVAIDCGNISWAK